MDSIIAFFVAAVISFWGSLQLGIVNVAVVETTLIKGGKQGLWLAIGGVLPEIPYTLLAIYGTHHIIALEEYKNILGLLVGLLLLLIGFYYLMKKAKKRTKEFQNTKNSTSGSFFKGMALAFLNPQLIFFWSGILILIETGTFNLFGLRDKLINFDANIIPSPEFSFALGASAGALLILGIYIWLTRKYRDKLPLSFNLKLNRIVGIFFIIVGLVAIVKNVV